MPVEELPPPEPWPGTDAESMSAPGSVPAPLGGPGPEVPPAAGLYNPQPQAES